MTAFAATSRPSETATSYDEIPYPSSSFPQTHPNRLAAMGRLFGMKAKHASEARVLELGCADGANILPMADQFPGASFVGLDTSRVQLAAGHKAIAAAGIENIELRYQDILDFPTSEGKFDYIIAQAVYSWVPEIVRKKLLAICTEHLAENGIAYISYNTLPGWNMRRSLREMMLFHTRNLADRGAKVQQARALLTFLAESVPSEKNAFGMLLKSELSSMQGLPDSYFLHDILGEENTAFYFHQFIEHAEAAGLQYLSEPDLGQMLASNFVSEKVRQTLSQLNNQIVAQEQYMDFLRNRFYRQTLLCRKGVTLRREVSPELLKDLSFRSLLVSATGPIDLVPGVAVTFSTAAGMQISSTDAFVKALLWSLSETRGVTAVSYQDLLRNSRSRSRPFLGEVPHNRDEIDELTLQTNLLNLLTKDLLEIYAEPVHARADVPERPLVGALARHQALNARSITNRLHQSVPADMVVRYILAACDGTRSRDELLDTLVRLVGEGKFNVNEGATRVSDPQKLRSLLGPTLDAGLKAIAGGGLFVP